MIKYNYYIFSIISIIFSLFSPIVSLILLFSILIIFSEYINKLQRRILAIMILFSYSLTISSMLPTSDFMDYYSIYQRIYNGDYSAIFNFGGGLEIGIGIIFYLLSNIFNIENPQYIMFIIVFFMSILFYIWLEKFPLKSINKNFKALALALALLYYNFTLSEHLIRQMFSMIFVLYAISYKDIKYKSLFLLLSGMFHLSGVIIYFLIESVKKYKMISIVFIFLFVYIFVHQFQTIYMNIQVFSTIIGGNNNIIDKLNPIMNRFNGSITSVDLSILKYILFIQILYLIYYFFNKNNKFFKEYFLIVILFTGLYFLFLTLPLMSYRMVLIEHAILLGILLFILFPVKYNKKFAIISKLFLLFIVYKRFISYIFVDQNSAFYFWYKFPWISIYPNYFIN